MLKLAAKHYLKSTGDKHFVPNPDYIEWVDVDCLDVAIKQKPKWLWQHSIYSYDHFGLNDLLDIPLPTDKSSYLNPPQILNPDFVWNATHHVGGKIGGKISSLVSLDLKSDDLVTIDVSMQNLMKQSVNYAAVEKILNERKINLASQYLRNLAQNRYNVVCLVTQYIYLSKATEIKISTKKCFDEDISTSKLKVSGSETADVNYNKAKTLQFPAGTRIAFELAECLLSPDGTITLLESYESAPSKNMIPVGRQTGVQLPNYCAHLTGGASHSFDMVDASTQPPIQSLVEAYGVMNALLVNNNRSDIVNHILQLKVLHPGVLQKLALFVIFCGQETGKQQISVPELKQFNSEMLQNEDLISVLKTIGVNTKTAPFTLDPGSINREMLEPLSILISAMAHLDLSLADNLFKFINKLDDCQGFSGAELVAFIQNVKFLNYYDPVLYKKLATSVVNRMILISLGVTDKGHQLTEEVEPTLLVLHAASC